jgi:hypothetical protein
VVILKEKSNGQEESSKEEENNKEESSKEENDEEENNKEESGKEEDHQEESREEEKDREEEKVTRALRRKPARTYRSPQDRSLWFTEVTPTKNENRSESRNIAAGFEEMEGFPERKAFHFSCR